LYYFRFHSIPVIYKSETAYKLIYFPQYNNFIQELKVFVR